MAFTKRIKPKVAVPIHDGFMKYPLSSLNRFDKVISEAGILVKAKLPGESVDV
ncbi:hypothetical protein HYX13_05615 [Candidatus Woesearchaeota archaeon]|nr:hypothetical protein [Candidatus Woesearchaeota archaeon]